MVGVLCRSTNLDDETQLVSVPAAAACCDTDHSDRVPPTLGILPAVYHS